MKKDLTIFAGLFLVVVALVIFGAGYSSISFLKGQTATGSPTTQKKTTQLSVKTLNITVDIASTADAKRKGLSGRDSLEINRGMLFVFDSSDAWAIWMKDMKFPIDIIWIDENKKIVSISPSALQEPGKKDDQLTIYKPSAKARYVLEINAGLSSVNNLQVGDSVNFSL